MAVEAPRLIGRASVSPAFDAYAARVAVLPSVVYLNSDAGMLHAFDAGATGTAGQERWFYVPAAKLKGSPFAPESEANQFGAVLKDGASPVNAGRLVLDHVLLDGWSNGLASVDGSPSCSAPGYVGSMDDDGPDVHGCKWHRVLLWTGGAGSRHVYALDVTVPDAPRVLWERGDTSAGAGRLIGAPSVGSFFDRAADETRWIGAWLSGIRLPDTATDDEADPSVQGRLHVQNLVSAFGDAPTAYPESGFALPVQAPAAGESTYPTDPLGASGAVAMVDLDGDRAVDAAWFGDSTGTLYKARFNPDAPTQPTICRFATPTLEETAPIVHAPALPRTGDGEVVVIWGTGSFDDYDIEEGGSLYAMKDPDPLGCSAGVPIDCAAASSLMDATGPGLGEFLTAEPMVADSKVVFTTARPAAGSCDAEQGRAYAIDLAICEGGWGSGPENDGTIVDGLYAEFEGVLSRPVLSHGEVYFAHDAGDDGAPDVVHITLTSRRTRFRVAGTRIVH